MYETRRDRVREDKIVSLTEWNKKKIPSRSFFNPHLENWSVILKIFRGKISASFFLSDEIKNSRS